MKQARGAVWRYRYARPDGKRPTATVGKFAVLSPPAAAMIVLDWIREGVDPLAEKGEQKALSRKAAQDRTMRTLRNYLENYYKPYMDRAWKPRNAQANYGRLKNRFASLLDRDMAALDKADIDHWQREAEQSGRAFATIRRNYGALRTLLNRAVQDKVISTNPLAGHKLLDPSLKDQTHALADHRKEARRLLTDEEVRGIMSGLNAFAEDIRRQRRNSRAHGKPNL